MAIFNRRVPDGKYSILAVGFQTSRHFQYLMLSADGSTGAERHGITKETIKTAYILNLLVIMWICLIDIIEIKMLKQFNLKKKNKFLAHNTHVPGYIPWHVRLSSSSSNSSYECCFKYLLQCWRRKQKWWRVYWNNVWLNDLHWIIYVYLYIVTAQNIF